MYLLRKINKEAINKYKYKLTNTKFADYDL